MEGFMERSSSSTSLQTHEAVPALKKGRYVAAAPVDAVLWEQIDYLLHHASSCQANCPDCRRLEQVRRCLLQPFE